MARKRKNNNGEIVGAFMAIAVLLTYLNKSLVFELLFWIISLIVIILVIKGVFYKIRKYLPDRDIPAKHPNQNPSSDNQKSSDTFDAFTLESNNKSGPAYKWSVDLISSLEWKRFEDLCAEYYRLKGYKIKVTPLGADGGVDIYLYGAGNMEKILGVVQCKAWTDKPVGVQQIRELYGVMTDLGCPLGIFITLKGFTQDAEQFANGKHIIFTDASSLLNLIKSLSEPAQQVLLEKITDGDFRTPSCPKCGIKLVVRRARGSNAATNRFWGCSNFPRCRYTMRMKKE